MTYGWAVGPMATARSASVPGEDLVIADAVRSPLSWADGALAAISPRALLAQTASALLDRTRLEPSAVTQTLIAGGSDFDRVARDACALMGIPPEAHLPSPHRGAPGSVLHRAAGMIGPRDVLLVLATSNTDRDSPAISPRRVVDAEIVASRWRLRRDDLDAYAKSSRSRANEVASMGEFASETVPAVAWSTHSRTVVTADQTLTTSASPFPMTARRHPYVGRHLRAQDVSRPAIGAAATILVGAERASELGIRPHARILALATIGDDPLGCGPISASQAAFERAGVHPNDIDHYEVSEAFSSIPLAWRQEFDADPDRFNPRGGSIALGRPGPASGLRSLATTLSALRTTGGRLGLLASEGPGQAGDAMLVEFLPRTCCSRDALRDAPDAGPRVVTQAVSSRPLLVGAPASR